MITIDVPNAHCALPYALDLLRREGAATDSRNGAVFKMDDPVTTLYRKPTQMAVLHPWRDANPFFHVMEALWMLGGRNDVRFIARFNGNIAKFSDDSETFHGAYGRRWRRKWGFDQLVIIARNLRETPGCRRQVLTMWDPHDDLVDASVADRYRDLPCNLLAHFRINRIKRLDMTVFCRSNDVVWGCYGSDSVTFGFLIEYMAAMIGVPVGRYWQISDDWHGYASTAGKMMERLGKYTPGEYADPYAHDIVETFPLVSAPDHFDSDLQMFLSGENAMGYKNRFFRRVATPMVNAWDEFKNMDTPLGRFKRSLEATDDIEAVDWRLACQQWIQRREAAWRARR